MNAADRPVPLGGDTGEMTCRRRKFLGLTAELDKPSLSGGDCRCDSLVDVAVRIRNMIRTEKVYLTNDEKTEVMGRITRAKLAALMSGKARSMDTLGTLDAVSNDMKSLL